tara:strand:- start:13 stop:288 length:276 start_codon:yes stop_codon:yes gene_type:complete
MYIEGKIIQVNDEISGEGANGSWRKQDYILETQGDYPKKICFTVWGEKIDEFAIKKDEEVNVSINLESREYNSKWYTDVKAWKVVKNNDVF